VAAGDYLITQTSFRGLYFFVLKEGVLDVINSADSLTRELNVGASFGALSLLYNKPPSADVVAQSNSRVWLIDRSRFKSILFGGLSQERTSPGKYMHHVSTGAETVSVHQRGHVMQGVLNMFSPLYTMDGHMSRQSFEAVLCELSESLLHQVATEPVLQRFTDDNDNIDMEALISWVFS